MSFGKFFATCVYLFIYAHNQINLVVEDEKVSIDDLQEQIQSLEDYVQSTDVAAMQKI